MPALSRPARPRHRDWLRALLLATLLLAPQIEARATAVAEAPWRADAAAYRATLFLADLDPVPWPVIAESWEAPYPGAETARPAIGLFPAADAEAIAAAIAAEDRHALFAAATRAVADAIARRLAEAEAALGSGDAAAPLAAARGLYRALEDGIRAADPQAARRLGLAWLELSTATGSRGVLGAGRTAADPAAFAAARTAVADYLAAEFAPAEFARRTRLAPIPDSAAGRDLALAPSLPPGSHIADQTPLPRLVLNFEARGIDETDLPLIAYGDMLFDSPEIFGDPRPRARHRLLDLPQSRRRQPRFPHPRPVAPGGAGGCGWQLLQSAVQRPARRSARHPLAARPALQRPLWPRRALRLAARFHPDRDRAGVRRARADARSCSTRWSPTCSNSISCRIPRSRPTAG